MEADGLAKNGSIARHRILQRKSATQTRQAVGVSRVRFPGHVQGAPMRCHGLLHLGRISRKFCLPLQRPAAHRQPTCLTFLALEPP